MAVTTRGSTWGGSSSNQSELLISYINDEIRVLEPELQYAMLGKKRDAPRGYDRILFPQTEQLATKIPVSVEGNLGGSVWGAGASIQGAAGSGAIVSSTAGVAAITEGTNPTAISWGATAYSTGQYQFGILVEVSDLLVRSSAIEVVDSCTRQVRYALARLVDSFLQTVVNSATNGVIYSGDKTSRATLAAGNTCTQTDIQKAVKNLRSSNAAGLRPYDGVYYAGVIHPAVMYDLMENTQTGSWADFGRYTSVDDLRAGKVGDFRGVRYLETAYQNYFNSTVPVMPTTILGEDSFGWGYFQEPQAMLTTTPDSNNPLGLYNSIGGKVTLGATKFEDAVGTYRIARVESAFTA